MVESQKCTIVHVTLHTRPQTSLPTFNEESLLNAPTAPELSRVDYRTEPARYRHWSLSVEGVVATLSMNVDETAGLRPGYQLKLNSYDLGVYIELHDAVNRVRFEHPGEYAAGNFQTSQLHLHRYWIP
jgi:hypothetical protein